MDDAFLDCFIGKRVKIVYSDNPDFVSVSKGTLKQKDEECLHMVLDDGRPSIILRRDVRKIEQMEIDQPEPDPPTPSKRGGRK